MSALALAAHAGGGGGARGGAARAAAAATSARTASKPLDARDDGAPRAARRRVGDGADVAQHVVGTTGWTVTMVVVAAPSAAPSASAALRSRAVTARCGTGPA